MDFLPVDLDVLVRHLLKLVGAFLLTLPVAWNREKATQAMGLRTFPLVSVASCGFVPLGQQALADAPMLRCDHRRLMTGIGFMAAAPSSSTKVACTGRRLPPASGELTPSAPLLPTGVMRSPFSSACSTLAR